MEDYYDKNQSPPSSCIDRQHMGGIFYDRGCGYQFSIYMKTWAGSVSAVAALFFLLEVCLYFYVYCQELKLPVLQISAVLLSYAMIKFKNKSYRREKEALAYSTKPLPAPPPEVGGSAR